MTFIKSITIDGFKSYGRRVEVSNFDSTFNAITGYNGSGKSNFLDALCFVLGLTKLELTRCTSLNELIYKNGQGGVTEAKVTIEIDNRDGKFNAYCQGQTFTATRLVRTNRTEKWIINGLVSSKEKYLEVFQMVGLNIANPRFLIQQGKIIQVVSMKAVEILSLLEETIGVSIFEMKKKISLRKIFALDKELEKISRTFEFSIIPKLEQLKNDESKIREYREVCSELDRTTKIILAASYLHSKSILENSDNRIETKDKLIEKLIEDNQTIKTNNREIKDNIRLLQSKIDEETGGELAGLETYLREKKEELERKKIDKKLKEDEIKDEEKKIAQLNKAQEKEQKSVEAKRKEFEKQTAKVNCLSEENANNEDKLKRAEQDYNTILLGGAKARDGQEAQTLGQQKRNVTDELASIESSINRSKLIIADNQRKLKEKQDKVKTDKTNYERVMKEIDARTTEVAKLERELAKVSFDEQRYNELKANLDRRATEMRDMKRKANDLESNFARAKFSYTRPTTADFRDSDVLGVVCNLFQVRSPEHALAIEKACAARLYNVVVANDRTGKALIAQGKLREARTFLPLNRMKGRTAELATLRAAEKLVGKGNVFFAINLVDFDDELLPAMQHVFGDTLVCPNMEMAKKVAFDDRVRKRTVTFEGELFDPLGTLTGGALRGAGDALLKIGEMNRLKREVARLQTICEDEDKQVKEMARNKDAYFSKKTERDRLSQQIELHKQSAQEDFTALLTEIEELKQSIATEEANIKKSLEDKKAAEKSLNELDKKLASNSDELREKEKKEAEKALEMARKALEASSKRLEKESQILQNLEQEKNHLDGQKSGREENVEAIQQNIEKIRKTLEKMTEVIELAQQDVNRHEASFNEYKDKLSTKSNEIQKLKKTLAAQEGKLEQNENTIKVTRHEIENEESDVKKARQALKTLVLKHPWMLKEEKLFASNETEYKVIHEPHFNLEALREHAAQLKAKKETLARGTNINATATYGEKMKEFEDLQAKRAIVIEDKQKVLDYVEKVEQQRHTALAEAYVKINQHFSKIFSSLLPLSDARLDWVNVNNQREGLEIRVAFGGIWKESLSELSGGQRSLCALSLVLALLRYNPAPLYILDEIDSALDSSHTANIGDMIKKHFTNAQFVIVSLKDDMYDNANAIFQTQFVDGFSKVERIN